MNLYHTIANISAAIAAGEEAQTLSNEQIAGIEDLLDSLGVFAAQIDDPLRTLERALTRLRTRNAGGDAKAQARAYAHVKDTWDAVEPALSQFASKVGIQANRPEK